ncbi:MAG: small multi-drug export protein [Methylocystaceae bacterium]
MLLTGKILLVGCLAVVALWGAIPAGLALGLSPLCVSLTAATGTSLGIIITGLLGIKFSGWVRRRYWDKPITRKNERLKSIWIRYGVPGLGIIAPLITGAPLGTILGIALGAPFIRLIWWMCIGALIWSILLTLVFAGSLVGLRLLCS